MSLVLHWAQPARARSFFSFDQHYRTWSCLASFLVPTRLHQAWLFQLGVMSPQILDLPLLYPWMAKRKEAATKSKHLQPSSKTNESILIWNAARHPILGLLTHLPRFQLWSDLNRSRVWKIWKVRHSWIPASPTIPTSTSPASPASPATECIPCIPCIPITFIHFHFLWEVTLPGLCWPGTGPLDVHLLRHLRRHLGEKLHRVAKRSHHFTCKCLLLNPRFLSAAVKVPWAFWAFWAFHFGISTLEFKRNLFTKHGSPANKMHVEPSSYAL